MKRAPLIAASLGLVGLCSYVARHDIRALTELRRDFPFTAEFIEAQTCTPTFQDGQDFLNSLAIDNGKPVIRIYIGKPDKCLAYELIPKEARWQGIRDSIIADTGELDEHAVMASLNYWGGFKFVEVDEPCKADLTIFPADIGFYSQGILGVAFLPNKIFSNPENVFGRRCIILRPTAAYAAAHELGHIIGLSHPHKLETTYLGHSIVSTPDSWAWQVQSKQDKSRQTVMSETSDGTDVRNISWLDRLLLNQVLSRNTGTSAKSQ